MNQSLFLHIVERLEGLVAKLPGGLQKPILNELTPLKELFLQQRPARLLLVGTDATPLPELINLLFVPAPPFQVVIERFTWCDVQLPERGTISILDARNAPAEENTRIEEETRRQSPDLIISVHSAGSDRESRTEPDLKRWSGNNDTVKVVPVVLGGAGNGAIELDRPPSGLTMISIPSGTGAFDGAKRFLSVLAREVPNPARIEMLRISQDKEAQTQVAQLLVKSTSAICTAIGAQPIPMADMPILTTLQLVMVSGIMYISGRERTLRAATEFVGAVGANVGLGMILREGARAALKFVPGWGNLISGMIAGAGTYAVGRAAIVFFLEGVSLKEARRIYITSRKKQAPPQLVAGTAQKRLRGRKKQRAGGRNRLDRPLSE